MTDIDWYNIKPARMDNNVKKRDEAIVFSTQKIRLEKRGKMKEASKINQRAIKEKVIIYPFKKKRKGRDYVYRKIFRDSYWDIQYCQECWATNQLQIHHIDKNKTNNKPGNLIKLCLECHIKKHNWDSVQKIMIKQKMNSV